MTKGQILEQLRAIRDDLEMNGHAADIQLILNALAEIAAFVRAAEKPRGRPKKSLMKMNFYQ